MNNDIVSELPKLLRTLRLASVRDNWKALIDQAEKEHWGYGRYLAVLCELECNERESRRISRFTKESALPASKTISSFDFSGEMAIVKSRVMALAEQPDWVDSAENLLLFGPSGVGKTHLAAAICHCLIEKGMRVKYFSTVALVQELQKARKELRLDDAMHKLDKYAVIILDDIGYVRKSEDETHVLFELIAYRYEAGSMIITSNQPFSQWDHIFSDSTMTVAAIDRLVHHSHIFDIQAKSYRKRYAELNHAQST